MSKDKSNSGSRDMSDKEVTDFKKEVDACLKKPKKVKSK